MDEALHGHCKGLPTPLLEESVLGESCLAGAKGAKVG